MLNSPTISLRPFQPADQVDVKNLILTGLVEHWGVLDASKNPDLDNIAASYSGAIFLVARRDGRIIGSGALVPRADNSAEVVRMSVASDCRRQGIGSKILAALVEHARQAGFHRVILETTATWQEVIEFYLASDFRITHYKDGDVYFEMELEDLLVE